MPVPIVDCHSHVFNAEDLPIDGFVKSKLFQVPPILTGTVSVPLDRLSQWLARSSREEAAYLASLLVPRMALEAGGPAVLPQRGSDLVSNEELDELFRLEWQRRGLLEDDAERGLEAGGDPDAELAAGITRPEAAQDRAELDSWLRSLGDEELERVLAEEALEGFRDWYERIKAAKRAVLRIVDALRLITKDRHLIAADLASTYPDVALFVPALVDFEHTANDPPASPVTEQIRVHSLLSKVSVVGKIPGAPRLRVHPIAGYCPYREVIASELRNWAPSKGVRNRYVPFADPSTASEEDRYRPGISYDPSRARKLREPTGPWDKEHLSLSGVTRSLDLVRHAIELGGYVGVKLYPPAGYRPLGNTEEFPGDKGERLDAALRSLYAYCTRMDVPILTHANYSNGFDDGYDNLASPDGWKLVLDEFPDLRVCFGHFGHLHDVGEKPDQPKAGSWARRFVELIDQYPHVYADVGNSMFPADKRYRNKYLSLLSFLLGGATPTELQQRRRRRVMFGTDFWLNMLNPAHRDYYSVFATHYREAFGDKASELFFGGNALRWLGIVDEDGQPDLTNANRDRLVAFYGTRRLPEWLG